MLEQTSNLSPEKQLLLRRRLRAAAGMRESERMIRRREFQGPAPLSFAQTQMWLVDQAMRGNPAYNLPMAYRISGTLRLDALEAGFQEMIKRHEILRTTFTVLNGEPAQIVQPAWRLKLKVVSLQHLPVDSRETSLHELARSEAVKQFDLTKLPLLRVSVFGLGDAEHLLLINLHHIISDGLSACAMMQELDLCYRAFLEGRMPLLPNLPIQYADFAVWEREQAACTDRSVQIDFWKKQLQRPPFLELPWDRQRPARQSFKGSNVYFEVPEQLCGELKSLAAAEGGTLFMILLAAFQAIIHRYSGASDIIVGTPISNRPGREVQPLIGDFLNMVALRCDLSGGPSFRDLLKAAKDTMLDALSHSAVPFQHVVEQLNFQRDPSRNPIFQVILQLLTRSQVRLSGLEIRDFDFDPGFAQFDLSLHVYEMALGCKGRFEYCSDLFNRSTIERFAGHFLNLLRQIVADPDRAVSSYAILTDLEKVQVLSDWNDTFKEYPRELCVHHLIEDQAARKPQAIAVVFENQSLTYAELNKRADHLARRLRALGVGPDVLVGLYVDRSLEMVIGLLGILKAGGAYVPIDPAYPADRVALILEDARAPVVVTQRRLLPTLRSRTLQVLTLDALDGASPPPPFTDPLRSDGPQRGDGEPRVPRSHNLAYTIYTSGSTGQPKGVQIEHRAVVNFIDSMRRSPGISTNDVLLAVTTLSFDIAGLELYLPLAAGAKIILASSKVAADSAALVRALNRHKVTMLQATPATWRLLLAAGWEGAPRLKGLCGGEVLPADLAAALIPRCAELWNMYGPTETTIWSACARVTEASDVHIGKPIANTEIYVLNTAGEPQPIGVVGELLIGGEGLARGYHNHPDLTAEKFITHPFVPGKRLFRTGDLARWRIDGNIDCLGRLDRQVKIRGFRIELGEIEAQLARHPKVKMNVVVAREDTPGDKRLVAYIVPYLASKSPEADDVVHLLRGKLPNYMIPAAFVVIDKFPLTPNGKIDLKALPPPDSSLLRSRNAYVAPRTPTEQKLVALWEETLQRHPISIRDNFFDIGGHSILAARIFNCVERQFNIRMPLAILFDRPTVEALANELDSIPHRTEKRHRSSLVAIQPKGSRLPFFCVHGAGGNVLLYRDLARHLGEDQPFYGLQSQERDEKVPLATIEEMAASYVQEILGVQPSGPFRIGGYCMGGLVAYEMARLLTQKGEEVALLALLDTYNLSALANGLTGGWLLQRVRFHWGNLSGLRLNQIAYYLREKLRIARDGELFTVWDRVFSAKNRSTSQGGPAPSRRSVQLANDRAAAAFKPRPYEGKVTVIKPAVNYDIFTDSDLGWASVALGGIEVVEIPVNPHAMLVDPFVNHLASELSKRLLDTAPASV